LGLGLFGCGAPGDAKISSSTRMAIADIAQAGGDTDSARTILAAAAAADPGNGELQLRYAAALLQAGRNDDAIGAARQAVTHNGGDAAFAVRAAQLELRAGDPGLAAATFRSAIADGAAGTPALNGLGVARVQLGDLAGAEGAFRRAIALSPGDYAARNNLALVLVLQGRADEAVPLLQSLANEPGVPGRVTHNLALAYAQQGDTRRAAQVLEGVEDRTEASREAAAFGTLRTGAPGLLADRLGPAELLHGRTSGMADAGAASAPVVADDRPAMRTAPLAEVQAAPITSSGQGGAAVAPPPVAPGKMPAVPDGAAPVLLSARLVAGSPPQAATPARGTAPTARVAVTEPSDDGRIEVRIATVPTRPAAMTFWQNLTGMAPHLLTGHMPLVRFTKEQGHAAWRLGTDGFQDAAAAEQFCRQLRKYGPDCVLGL
jgi:Flp pilus assembly protein TadD